MLYFINHKITLLFKKLYFIINKNLRDVKNFLNYYFKFKNFAINFFIQFIYFNDYTLISF